MSASLASPTNGNIWRMRIWRVFNKNLGECFEFGESQKKSVMCHFNEYSHSLNSINSLNLPKYESPMLIRLNVCSVSCCTHICNQKQKVLACFACVCEGVGEREREREKFEKRFYLLSTCYFERSFTLPLNVHAKHGTFVQYSPNSQNIMTIFWRMRVWRVFKKKLGEFGESGKSQKFF